MRDWRRWLSAVLLVAFAVAVIARWGDVRLAAAEVASMSPAWIVVLIATAGAWIVANGWIAAAITSGLGPTRGVMVQQVATAANNSVVGSGPVNVGLRVAMLHSWRVSHVGVAVTLATLNVVAATKLWGITLLVAAVGTTGAADGVLDRRLFLAGGIAALAVLGGLSIAIWAVLRRPTVLAWVARKLGPAFASARRRTRRIPDLDVSTLAEEFRAASIELVRRRGARIAVATGVEQMVYLALPVLIVRAVGIDSDVVSAAQVLVSFAVVRLVAALTPIPGGIGVVELGTVAMLVGFGAVESTALAAVLTFRLLTFVLPMLVGSLCFLAWRRQHRRAHAELEVIHERPDAAATVATASPHAA